MSAEELVAKFSAINRISMPAEASPLVAENHFSNGFSGRVFWKMSRKRNSHRWYFSQNINRTFGAHCQTYRSFLTSWSILTKTPIAFSPERNKDILENIRQLSTMKKRIWFRYVILPGYTDTEENLSALISFCKTIHFELIELLPYHEMGGKNGKQKDSRTVFQQCIPRLEKSVEEIRKQLEQEHFRVVVNE